MLHQWSYMRGSNKYSTPGLIFICVLLSAPLAFGEPRVKAAALDISIVRSKVDSVVNRLLAKKTKVSIVIESQRSGRILYEKNPDLRLHPASNTKVITTAATLDLLGPQFRWETRIGTDKIKNGVAKNLYLIGRGDPRFVSESLWALVLQAKKNGLKRVTGDLIVDDSYFTADRMAPGFNDKNQDSAYRAASGAMSLNFNSVSIGIKPSSKIGGKPRVNIYPDSGHILVKNMARTTRSGREQLQLRADAKDARTEVKLSGTIPKKHRGLVVRRRIDNPPMYAGAAAKLFLKKVGIKVRGAVKTGRAPAKLSRLSRLKSRPLSLIIQDVNKLSNNFMAEQILRTIGAEKSRVGDWSQSAKLVTKHLGEHYKLSGFTYVNGSGLFGNTAFSARELTTVLRKMNQLKPPKPEFLASLAVSRVDGTLKKRFKSVPKGTIRAKTGTLNGVVCLSGYLYTKNGDTLVFSILMNDVVGKGWSIWKVQEDILLAFAGYPDKDKK
jgi:D-alanyl-D-alanine carboxypeptidase/D-alanyl-D-alanine-endopeptidase (penicillin-binding protein 4)